MNPFCSGKKHLNHRLTVFEREKVVELCNNYYASKTNWVYLVINAAARFNISISKNGVYKLFAKWKKKVYLFFFLDSFFLEN
jgi:hypothetical protein